MTLKLSLEKAKKRAARKAEDEKKRRQLRKPQYIKLETVVRDKFRRHKLKKQIVYMRQAPGPRTYYKPPASHTTFDWLLLKKPLLTPPHLLHNATLVRNLCPSIEGRLQYIQSFDPSFLKPQTLTGVQKASRAKIWALVPPAAIQTNAFRVMKNRLEADFFMEMRLRRLFRIFLMRFRLRKMDQLPQDGIDPITFSSIETPIAVYDMKQRRKFVFEASTLVKCIEKNLMLHQHLIPSPKQPINVITNMPFTYAQLLSIDQQLTEAKKSHLTLSLFEQYNFSIERWKVCMYRTIRVIAIKDELYNHDSIIGRELLGDFIIDYMYASNTPMFTEFEDILRNAIDWHPNHALFQTMRHICMSHNDADILRYNIHVILLHAFKVAMKEHYPTSQLWIDVQERMYAEAQEEAEEEAADIAAAAAAILILNVL